MHHKLLAALALTTALAVGACDDLFNGDNGDVATPVPEEAATPLPEADDPAVDDGEVVGDDGDDAAVDADVATPLPEDGE